MFSQHLQDAIAQQAERQKRTPEGPADLQQAAADASADALALAQMSDDSLEPLAASARATQEKLQNEAGKREAEYRKAKADFEADPREKTHAARAVAEQLWQNAAAEVTKHAESVRDVLAEADRRRHIRKLADLRGQVDVSAEIAATAARVVTIFERFQSSISEELQRLGATLAAREAVLEELNNLARKYGTSGPEVHRPIALDRAVATLGDAVAAQFGRAQDGGNFGRLSWWVPGGRADLAVAEAALRIPCPAASGG